MTTTETGHMSRKRKPSPAPNSRATKKQAHSLAKSKSPAPPPSLLGPHAAILRDLAKKYNILPASVISSTTIRKRLVHITCHLTGTGPANDATATATTAATDTKPRVVLLYARAPDVCKMVTVVEKCKRIFEEQASSSSSSQQQQHHGAATWYQYNQLFDMLITADDDARANRKKKKKKKKRAVEAVEVVQEKILHAGDGDAVRRQGGEEEDHDSDSDGDSQDDAFETMQATRFKKAVMSAPPPARTTKSLRIFLSTAAMPEMKTRDGVTVQWSGQQE